jgi:hypothetical protein
MNMQQGKVVLLFFKYFYSDRFVSGDRYLRGALRPIYNIFRGPKISGPYVSYQLLAKALRQEGYRVRLNDYKLARENRNYPVGLVGHSRLLDEWDLSNPALLGPALFDHPKMQPALLEDSRYKRYLVTCEWMKNLFEPFYGPRCVRWYAGIDIDFWGDTRNVLKKTDVLIYDKIRWNRDIYINSLIRPIVDTLDQRNLTYRIIQYGHHDHNGYKKLLSQSRCLIFLCEHETQGLAYQEAMASNLPVLAWDNGYWLDPRRGCFDPNPIPTSSVPYFSPECGERFAHISDFQDIFDTFWARLDTYQPRFYVQRELSFQGSAKLYMKYYCETADM